MSHDQHKAQPAVQVDVLYFEGCPNHPPTVERIRTVADHLGIELNLKEIEVTADDDPDRLGFRGSPTVQVNGLDIDPAERGQADCGFGCRTYGGAGVPDEAMIETALIDPPAHGRSSGSASLSTHSRNSASEN